MWELMSFRNLSELSAQFALGPVRTGAVVGEGWMGEQSAGQCRPSERPAERLVAELHGGRRWAAPAAVAAERAVVSAQQGLWRFVVAARSA